MNLFDQAQLKWVHFAADEGTDCPINYRGAVLSIRDDGHIDLLYRWEPNAYCHFHRHVAHTTSVVLAGELHVAEIKDGKPGAKRIRKAGDYAHKDPGDVHMEHGGPDGALVLFTLYAPDGKLVDFLGADGQTITTITLDDMVPGGRIARLAA